MQTFLSHVSTVIFALAFVLFIADILRKKWQPQRISWFIFSIVDAIMMVTMLIERTVNGTVVVATVGASTIAVLSIWRGLGGWTKMDIFCGICALVGGLVALVNPYYGLLASCAVILIGAIPTWGSIYREPEKQNGLAWAAAFVGSLLCALNLPDRSVATSAQPIAFLLINALAFFLIWPERE